MQTKPNRRQGRLHFLSQSVEEAIDCIVGQYPDLSRKGTVHKSFITLFSLDRNSAELPTLMDAGFGRNSPNDDGAARFEIGVVGKIWALLCLLPLSKPLQADAGGTAVNASYSILGPNTEKKVVTCLSFLIKTTTTDYSKPQNKLTVTPQDLDHYFLKVRDHAIKCLQRAKVVGTVASTRAKLDAALAGPFSSPEQCARHLYSVFDLDCVEGGPRKHSEGTGPMHDFEPVLQQFIDNEVASERDKDPEIEHAINLVLKKLENYKEKPTKPHIALVLGDEQSGKKSVVGDLLRRLSADRKDDDPVTLNVRYAAGVKMRLPILAMSLRNHDYGSLAAYVLAFLMRANGNLDQTADLAQCARVLKQQHIKGGSLDEVMTLIEREHKKRATMFIFLDAHSLDRDSLQRVLQNSGLYRLLVRLWRTNDQSRYLITTTNVDFAYAPTELKLTRKNSSVTVPYPKISRFAWYLSTDDLKRYRQVDPLLPSPDGQPQSLEEALSEFARALDRELLVTGDVLLTMSALYASGIDNKRFFEIGRMYLTDQNAANTVEDTTDAALTSTAADNPRLATEQVSMGRARVFQELIAVLETDDLLLPLTLVAATRFTEDVLTTSSLKELCRRYFASFDSEFDDNALEDYWSVVAPRLEETAAGARTLFLSRYQQFKNDPDELGYREGLQERGQNWYMSSAVATSLLQELFADPKRKHLAKDAFRLVATAARRRAQLKRMRRSEDASSSDRGEIARDIQCYISLLASLPDTETSYGREEFGSSKSRALRLSLDEVFTISDTFNPVHALRFAVQCVLKQDIDEGYRLSMVTDQDELRLRLYLLIFFPIGELHTWTIAQMRGSEEKLNELLPEHLPQHVMEFFEPETRLDLLLTVALAAYHSQLPDIVAWAWRMSNEVSCAEDKAERQRHLAIRARIAGTVIDAGIASGKNVVGSGKLNKVLSWTEEQSKPVLAEIGFDPLIEDSDIGSALPQKLKLIQSRMRLAAREAELNWIARNDLKTARKIYQRLEALEHAIARHIDQAEPVVLSGRTARRYARLLSWDYPVFAEPWFADTIPVAPAGVTRKIRHVIEANVGRLNHYAGADRIGVLVDQARRHCIAADFDLAYRYIKDAYSRLENSKISHGGRLDLLAVKAGIHLALAETALQNEMSPEKHLADARKHIGTLVAVSKKLKFQPPMVIGEFLQARVRMLENADAGTQLLDDTAKASLNKCIKLANACGYSSAKHVALRWKSIAK